LLFAAMSRPSPDPPPPAREPDPKERPGAAAEPEWRASSYDLEHGLDVVELPTLLPVEVLDRLFNAAGK
jgi:hypothetical protein